MENKSIAQCFNLSIALIGLIVFKHILGKDPSIPLVIVLMVIASITVGLNFWIFFKGGNK